ncbi:hypothetical protein E2562_024985 [Oryza meyeriana var. granulata]|uniref:Uncharacterized protein n=1 Tax=Oryza meyeriana var. granulata TaxID=110450 RepID=A0A6G1FBN0_9ORYZ|nr:hypothetical protein E2562_024985 [Oryza meyeriana var. granulata]
MDPGPPCPSFWWRLPVPIRALSPTPLYLPSTASTTRVPAATARSDLPEVRGGRGLLDQTTPELDDTGSELGRMVEE